MDKRTHSLYTPAIYQTMLERFDIDPAMIEELDGFESFIYKFFRENTPFILRISHSLHHPPERTQGEMDFLHYLACHGLAVPQPQPSLNGNLVEVISVPPTPELPEPSYFSGVVFDFAPGGPPVRSDWTPELFLEMGRYLGRLHALSRHYVPTRPEYRRHFWYEDEEDYARRYLPPDETIIIEKFEKLVRDLKNLPRDPDVFGLIHIDFHGLNFYIDRVDGKIKITLFDFDDCCYAPYVYDIAMALFYVVPHRCENPEDLKNAQTFYNYFLKGYREHFPIQADQLKLVPDFLKLREMDLYMIIHRSRDLDQLGPWEASFMKGRKERLENGVPYLEIDFRGE